jgi:hypothetical protein
MTDLLQEFCDSRGVALRVDSNSGVVRGIKVLGLRSRNGREYLPEALTRAIALYEGAKVNVNHPKGHPLAPRDYQERIGVIRNVQHRSGDGLFADFHFNPKHYLAELLAWDAQHAPENVGFSHNVQARTSRRGETTLVEEIVSVHSVDLVADPATTRGLFESTDGNSQAAVADLTSVSQHPEIQSEEMASSTSPASLCPTVTGQRSDSITSLCQEQAAEIGKLRTEIDRLRAQQAIQQRRARVLALLAEHHLPNPDSADAATRTIVSDTFIETLLAAADEATLRRLVEERARLVGSARQWALDGPLQSRRPVSRDQCKIDAYRITDGRTFARAIGG